jgi:hypothetical protein
MSGYLTVDVAMSRTDVLARLQDRKTENRARL